MKHLVSIDKLYSYTHLTNKKEQQVTPSVNHHLNLVFILLYKKIIVSIDDDGAVIGTFKK